MLPTRHCAAALGLQGYLQQKQVPPDLGFKAGMGLAELLGVPFEWGTLEGQAQQEPAWSEEIWSLSLRVAFARI